jgi:uncharacterized protein (TIGR03437 family)
MMWTWACSTVWPAARPSLNPMFKPSGFRPVSRRARASPTSSHTAFCSGMGRLVDGAHVLARRDQRVAVSNGEGVREPPWRERGAIINDSAQMRNLFSLVFLTALSQSGIAQIPSFTAASVVNSASLAPGAIAPREIVSILGSNLGPASNACSNSSHPISCGGFSVLVNGNSAPLLFVQSSQINFQVPVDVSGPSATIQVTGLVSGKVLQSEVVTIPVAAVAPGLYTRTQNGVAIGNFSHMDFSLITPGTPAVPGDMLIVYGTGFGKAVPGVGPTCWTNEPGSYQFSLFVGGKVVAVLSACSLDPNADGIDEILFRVPYDISAGNLPVVITMNGQVAPSVSLPVALTRLPTITSIVNSASGGVGAESGSWVSIYGNFLSASTRQWQSSDFAGNLLPTTLDGVRVMVNGKNAAISYISPGQLNILLPTDTVTGAVQVGVTNTYGTASGTVTIQSYAPGFFTFQGGYAAALHLDGGYVAPTGYFGASTASRPAQPGEFLQIYGVGFGPTTPAIPAGQVVSAAAPLTDLTQLHVLIGGASAFVQFAGIVAAGEYQINVLVPPLPDGDQPIVATIGGVSSQSGVSITIKN